jgi:hypothetical protein
MGNPVALREIHDLGSPFEWVKGRIKPEQKMNVPLREGLLALVTLSTSAACAGSSVRTGFGFCPPPPPPACMDDNKVYDSGPETKDCQEKVSHYIASVFAYRACLLRETQRAVPEAKQVTSSEARDFGAAAGPDSSPTDGRQQMATAVARNFSPYCVAQMQRGPRKFPSSYSCSG